MRSELIHTHRTCNQNCAYCTVRRPADDPAEVRGAAVRARIAAAVAAGAREVVLSGGEPAMRADLAGLVAAAVAAGAERVVLETNATLVNAARAEAWRAAGLTHARVNLTAWGAALDALTRDPGGFERTLAGLRALAAAGVAVDAAVVVVRSTLAGLPALPAQLAAAAPGALRGMVVRVPTASPDPAELVDYPAAAAALVALDAAARRVGLPVKLAPDSGPPPCVFPQASPVAHLYALTPGAAARADHVHPAACAGCVVRAGCAGVPRAYLERWPLPPLRPVVEDRVRRRLSLIATVEEQVRREFVQLNRHTDRATGAPVEEDLIRVNFHCNQACRFCFVSTHLPPAGDAAVRAAIVAAGAAGRQVTLTGGEPTLHPRLAEFVALARAHSRHPVALQTNAVRLADPAAVAALVAAGLGWVQVSLHASHAALSDAMTEAPGTFAKTVVGLDHLHAHAGVYLAINFVITRRNHAELVPVVRLVAARWPRAFLNVSFVGASSDVVPCDEALVPRYADVLPDLLAALAAARALGVEVGGFESMCGVPLCLVPAADRPAAPPEIPAGYEGGEFVQPPVCAGCGLRRRCFGVRRNYYALYGAADLRALPAADAPPAARDG